MSQEPTKTQNDDWAPVIAKVTFLLLTIVLLGTVVFLVRKVLHAIILGMLCAGAFMPVHNWIHRKIANSIENWRIRHNRQAGTGVTLGKSVSAFLSVTLVCICIVLPLGFLTVNVAKQGQATVLSALLWIEKDLPAKTHELMERYKLQETWIKWHGELSGLLKLTEGKEIDLDQLALDITKEAAAPEDKGGEAPQSAAEKSTVPNLHSPVNVLAPPPPDKPQAVGMDPGELLVAGMRKALALVLQSLLAILSRAWATMLNFLIMLFVMYHIFYDGNSIWQYLKSISPLGDDEQRQVTDRIKDVTRAIFYGVFGAAAMQGVLAMLCFSLVGIPALFWGVMLGFCSLIPFVGTGLVWIPAVVYLYLSGSPIKAAFIFITCGCIVSNANQLLCPLLMKRSGKTGMSFMVLFFAMLGGLQTFGLVGIIYGPLLVGICSICLLIFSTQFKHQSKPNAQS
ncbi:MAG: AI-2E family transporter [Victivallales bacterium]|nr:AI-2E family transporter [Victivallales bacterium]